MKNRLINIVCGTLIVISLLIVARSLIATTKKPNQNPQQYENKTQPTDPLTEVDFEEVLIHVGRLLHNFSGGEIRKNSIFAPRNNIQPDKNKNRWI